ncbi:MAG: hypothetical protein NT118_09595 [Lentisphaerae bacterium]|nr:hypothetical protein [Lentisphaerota bacterium]
MIFVQDVRASKSDDQPEAEFILILEKNQVNSSEPLNGELIILNKGDKPINVISATSTYLAGSKKDINIDVDAYGSNTYHLIFTGLSSRTTEITLVIAFTSQGAQVLNRGIASAPIKVLNWLGFDFDPFWPLLLGSALTLATTYILSIISIANERSKAQRNAIGHLKTFCNSIKKYLIDFEEIPVDFWRKAFLEGQTLIDIREREKKKVHTGTDTDTVDLIILADKFNDFVGQGARDRQDVREFIESFKTKTNNLLKKVSKIE